MAKEEPAERAPRATPPRPAVFIETANMRRAPKSLGLRAAAATLIPLRVRPASAPHCRHSRFPRPPRCVWISPPPPPHPPARNGWGWLSLRLQMASKSNSQPAGRSKPRQRLRLRPADRFLSFKIYFQRRGLGWAMVGFAFRVLALSTDLELGRTCWLYFSAQKRKIIICSVIALPVCAKSWFLPTCAALQPQPLYIATRMNNAAHGHAAAAPRQAPRQRAESSQHSALRCTQSRLS